MPLITYDSELATLVIQSLTYIFRAIGALLKSIITSDNAIDIFVSIWGAIYWLIKDINLFIDLFGNSTVQIELGSFTSLNFAPIVGLIVGPTDASYGLTYILNYTGNVIESDPYLGSSLAYYLFDMLSYMPEFFVQLINALPTAFTWG